MEFNIGIKKIDQTLIAYFLNYCKKKMKGFFGCVKAHDYFLTPAKKNHKKFMNIHLEF